MHTSGRRPELYGDPTRYYPGAAGDLLTQLVDTMYRTVFMPPNAPAAAVEEMRGAFEKLAKDPEFIVDYEKVTKFKPHFIAAAEGDRVIAQLGAVDPSMVRFFTKYVETAK